MKYKITIFGILSIAILLILPFPSVNAKINNDSSKIKFQQADTSPPAIYFDLSGINSTHNIVQVTVFEPDYPSNLTSAEIKVNNNTKSGVFSFANYSFTPPPISPTNFEATPPTRSDTYTYDVDTQSEFTPTMHNIIEAEGENSASITSMSSILFCNNQECWNPGLNPSAHQILSTNTQKSSDFEYVDYFAPLIEFNLVDLSCCGLVYFQVSDFYSDVTLIETSFVNNTLKVKATDSSSLSSEVTVNFGDFTVTSICMNDPCDFCDYDADYTGFTHVDVSFFIVISCVIVVVHTIRLRKRK